MLLLRHGQSYFNKHFSVTRVDPGIPDPRLTEEGLAQIEAAAQVLAAERAAGRRLTRILASPYWRTLETAEVLSRALGLPVEIEVEVRERAFFVCDIGSPRSELEARFPAYDFSALPEVWWPPLDETEEKLDQRCAAFRARIATVPTWQELLIVTHWGFIRGLTGQSVANATLVPFSPHPDQTVAPLSSGPNP